MENTRIPLPSLQRWYKFGIKPKFKVARTLTQFRAPYGGTGSLAVPKATPRFRDLLGGFTELRSNDGPGCGL